MQNKKIWLTQHLNMEIYKTLSVQIDNLDSPLELHFDCPGGDVLGVAEIAEKIYAKRDLITAYVHGACTSAAYWLASAASKIILCSETTIVGSIGLKLQHVSRERLLEQQGIKITEIATGKEKVVGGDTKNLSQEDKLKIEDTLNKLYKVFYSFVAKTRDIKVEDVINMQAKEYVGKEAIAAKLADSLITITTTGEKQMDEELKKENELLKKEVEELKKKIEELVAQLEPEPEPQAEGDGIKNEEDEKKEEMTAKAERHRILAIMSLNKGGISESVVQSAIAKGWDYSQTIDEITKKISDNKKGMTANRVVPLGDGATEKVLSSMIAKGGK